MMRVVGEAWGAGCVLAISALAIGDLFYAAPVGPDRVSALAWCAIAVGLTFFAGIVLGAIRGRMEWGAAAGERTGARADSAEGEQ